MRKGFVGVVSNQKAAGIKVVLGKTPSTLMQ